MVLWYQNRFAALVENIINAGNEGRLEHGKEGSVGAREERTVRAYNHTLLSGKIRRAVSRDTIR